MKECDECSGSFKRSEIMPVSTFQRGILLLCKNCAKNDREMAKEEINRNGIKITFISKD